MPNVNNPFEGALTYFFNTVQNANLKSDDNKEYAEFLQALFDPTKSNNTNFYINDFLQNYANTDFF